MISPDGIAVACASAFDELAGDAERRPPRPAATGRRLDPDAAADHLDRLFRTALALCGSRQLAEDLVQETYLRVLSRPRVLRRDDDLSYLVRALRNTWYNHLRSRDRVELVVDDEDRASPRPVADPEISAEAREVLAAVAELPPRFREVVAAVDLAGLAYKETAKALRIPTGTVMSRLYRARAQIAGQLAGHTSPNDPDEAHD